MDDLSLLCETCGYPIQGLPIELTSGSGADASRAEGMVAERAASVRGAQCPECGTGIAESLPGRRGGSPWQRGASLGSWLSTIVAMIRRPTATFGEVIVSESRAGVLLSVNVLLTSLLLAPPLVGVLTIDPVRAWRGRGPVVEWLAWAVSLGCVTLVLYGFFGALTLVEFFGIRFFARRRRFRLSRAAALQVCAHASVGWLAAGILPYLFAPAALSIVQVLGLGDRRLDLSPYYSLSTNLSAVASIVGFAVGVMGGMVAFEWLVFLGVGRNRFANHAGATGSARTAGSGREAGSENRPT